MLLLLPNPGGLKHVAGGRALRYPRIIRVLSIAPRQGCKPVGMIRGVAAIPAGIGTVGGLVTGGVAVLDPRLQAIIPPGWIMVTFQSLKA